MSRKEKKIFLCFEKLTNFYNHQMWGDIKIKLALLSMIRAGLFASKERDVLFFSLKARFVVF